MPSPALAKIIQRLDKVQRRGRQYIARCPAHEDRTPSLSLAETSQGMVLLHCFAGCEPAKVLHAIGLTLADLYPDYGGDVHLYESLERQKRQARLHRQRKAGIDREVTIRAEAAWNRATGHPLTSHDLERERHAEQRIQTWEKIYGPVEHEFRDVPEQVRPRSPIKEALDKACDGLPIEPHELKRALSDEDIEDIRQGLLEPEALRAYAEALAREKEADT